MEFGFFHAWDPLQWLMSTRTMAKRWTCLFRQARTASIITVKSDCAGMPRSFFKLQLSFGIPRNDATPKEEDNFSPPRFKARR